MVVSQCPYDPNDCPKIQEIRRIVQKNESDLTSLKEAVIKLETAIHTATKTMIVLATIIAGALGLNLTEIIALLSGGG